jgi:hypothetical protein
MTQITVIPIYMLLLSRVKRKWKFSRYESQDMPLARKIADLHRRNRQNPLPFLENHTKGPVYLSPRC